MISPSSISLILPQQCFWLRSACRH
jgi:hypothetical protein